jgi:hypothetical protein
MKNQQNKFIITDLKRDLNNLDIRAFLKKYAKNLKGPGKVAILVFCITQGLNKSVNSNQIKKQWNKVKSILGKYSPSYIARAREYGFLKEDNNKRGCYKLTDFWLERLITKEGSKFLKIVKKEEQKKISRYKESYIFSISLLNKIKKQDMKIFVLGFEANFNWQTKCWNACGILMRIILERVLDKKDNKIKQITGLDPKINHCLSNKIFGKTILDTLKKLQHSTKITGDIVAHDSNILLDKNDIEISIVPLNMLIKEVFKL